MYSAFCVFLVLGPILIKGQESPCPNIFEYRYDGGGTYGVIHLQSNGPVSSVFIRANFTIAFGQPRSLVSVFNTIQIEFVPTNAIHAKTSLFCSCKIHTLLERG